METVLKFPAVDEFFLKRRRGSLEGFIRPFLALGDIALAALEGPETRRVGSDVIDFLARVSLFILGEESTAFNTAEHSRLGWHTYEHKPLDEAAGIELAHARAELLGPKQNYPVTRVVVQYQVEQSPTPLYTSAVSMGFEFGGHPTVDSYYARLSGDQQYGNTLRVATGTVNHGGIPQPDSRPSFEFLSALSEKLAGLESQNVSQKR